MNKQEITAVVVLFALLLLWMNVQSRQYKPPPETQKEQTTEAVENPAAVGSETNRETVVEESAEKPETQEKAVTIEETIHLLPEELAVLSSETTKITVSSHGGGIVSVELTKYDEGLEKDSGPVVLDFSGQPALSLSGVAGLSAKNDFGISLAADKKSLKISAQSSDGLVLYRTMTLEDGYRIKVSDVFSNPGTNPVVLPEVGVALGPMQMIKTKGTSRAQYAYLGLDTFSSAGGGDVIHWANSGPKGDDDDSLAARFQGPDGPRGCGPFKSSLTKPLPESIDVRKQSEVDWIAVKNKFFVQILAPEEAGSGFDLRAERSVPDSEDPENSRSWTKTAVLNKVLATMSMPEYKIKPGESVTREMSYYIGPQKHSILKQLGKNQDKIMFRAWPYCGWFRSICVGMLWTLNKIYKVIPNYGVAIILLTIIVKILFWPFMHKSTENMKKMQKIQPLIKELKEKHKDNPQKLQRESMALYKEHGVNPMASCFPMLFQMPVFIGLFIVLRSAVELRFAPFLWISDLSEPEGLLQGLPLIGQLNILPVLMTVTMVWQQKLTPAAGDAQQQKMMMFFMPAFLLFIMYKMPSALTLYWTVSQLLAIVQLLVQKRKDKPDVAQD